MKTKKCRSTRFTRYRVILRQHGLRELRKPVSRHDPGAVLTTVVTTQVLQVYIYI